MCKILSFILLVLASGMTGACAAANNMQEAIINNDLARIQDEINNKTDLNKVVNGRTYLWWATGPFVCRPKIIQLLIENGADPKVTGKDGQTTLGAAADSCPPETLALVVSKGAVIDQADTHGNTPLMMAAGGREPKNVAFLLNQGAKANVRNEYGMTPLLLAAGKGTAEAVKTLLDHGVDATAVASDGSSILMYAAHNNRGNLDARMELLRTILALKPDVNLSNKEGLTALLVAIRVPNIEGAQLLIEQGADAKVSDQTGRTALIDAVNVGMGNAQASASPVFIKMQANVESLIKTLLEKGVKVDAQTTDIGANALMIAVNRRETSVVKMLLEAKADLNLKDKRGMTALDISKSKKAPFVTQEDKDIQRILEEAGAK